MTNKKRTILREVFRHTVTGTLAVSVFLGVISLLRFITGSSQIIHVGESALVFLGIFFAYLVFGLAYDDKEPKTELSEPTTAPATTVDEADVKIMQNALFHIFGYSGPIKHELLLKTFTQINDIEAFVEKSGLIYDQKGITYTVTFFVDEKKRVVIHNLTRNKAGGAQYLAPIMVKPYIYWGLLEWSGGLRSKTKNTDLC